MINLSKIQSLVASVESQIEEGTESVDAEKLGLDPQVGKILVGGGFIAISTSYLLDYYGFFGQVESQHVYRLGIYKIYTVPDARVVNMLAIYEHGKVHDKT